MSFFNDAARVYEFLSGVSPEQFLISWNHAGEYEVLEWPSGTPEPSRENITSAHQDKLTNKDGLLFSQWLSTQTDVGREKTAAKAIDKSDAQARRDKAIIAQVVEELNATIGRTAITVEQFEANVKAKIDGQS